MAADREQSHKSQRSRQAGPSANKGADKINQGKRRTEIDQRRLHNPTIEAAPYVVVVQGPSQVGKSLLIKSLVKHYANHNLQEVRGPITVVAGKQRRVQFVECPNDITGMIDAGKYADLALLLLDASYGFEMETFEFLTIMQNHGFPKVVGVLTHLDKFKDAKKLDNTIQRLKHRFWAKIYNGAKLFYLSALAHWKYGTRETRSLARFISVMEFHPQVNHPYILVDRFEDVTPPELVHANNKCGRNVALYGYSHGCNLKKGTKVHIAGVGDYSLAGTTRLPDPCPLPSVAKMKGFSDKEKLFYAPMSGLGDLLYEKHGVYIDNKGKPAYEGKSLDFGDDLVKSLQNSEHSVDEKLVKSLISLLLGKKQGDQEDDVGSARLVNDDDDDDGEERLVNDDDDGEESDGDDGEEGDQEDDVGSARLVNDDDDGEESDDDDGEEGDQEDDVGSARFVNDDDDGEENDDDDGEEGDREDDVGSARLVNDDDDGEESDDDDGEEGDQEDDVGSARFVNNDDDGEESDDDDGEEGDQEDDVGAARLVNDNDDGEESDDDDGKECDAADLDGFEMSDGEEAIIGDSAGHKKHVLELEPGRKFHDGRMRRKVVFGDDADHEEDSVEDVDMDDTSSLDSYSSEDVEDSESDDVVFPNVEDEERDAEFFKPKGESSKLKEVIEPCKQRNIDESTRAKISGFGRGTYLRFEVHNVPFEMILYFNPRHPLLVGGIGLEEESVGHIQIWLKRHRWHKKVLKTRDPITVSIGWRRYQTKPVYANKDENGRHQMLEHTPVICLAMFWGPLAPPNTAVIALQSLSNKHATFRVATTATVKEFDHAIKIVQKEIKRVGEPCKYLDKTTALITLEDDIAIESCQGADVVTMTGIRGKVKEAKKGSAEAVCTFEDRIPIYDLVHLHSWNRVDVAQFYNSLYVYKPMERKKFNPLEIAEKLEALLPYIRNQHKKDIRRPSHRIIRPPPAGC